MSKKRKVAKEADSDELVQTDKENTKRARGHDIDAKKEKNFKNHSSNSKKPVEPAASLQTRKEIEHVEPSHGAAESSDPSSPSDKDPENVDLSPKRSEDSADVICQNGISIKIRPYGVLVTSPTGETFTIEPKITTIDSGSCQIEIKDGVFSVKSSNFDSVFNFYKKK